MRVVEIMEDVICIILLLFLPDFLLEKLGLYESMRQIIKSRSLKKSR